LLLTAVSRPHGSSSSTSCGMDEKRTNIYINGTRIAGCVHSEDEFNKNLAIILGVLIPVAFIVIIFIGCCAFNNYLTNKCECCYKSVSTKEDDAYVESHLGKDSLYDFKQGNFTPHIIDVIARARAQDGPTTNGKFMSYFQHHVAPEKKQDALWVSNKSFELCNIQPM